MFVVRACERWWCFLLWGWLEVLDLVLFVQEGALSVVKVVGDEGKSIGWDGPPRFVAWSLAARFGLRVTRSVQVVVHANDGTEDVAAWVPKAAKKCSSRRTTPSWYWRMLCSIG